jgi:threonine dehydrogenase-like Zn-dependent dehydrogenase
MEQLTAWLTGPESIEFRGGPVPKPGPEELLISVGAAVTCGTDVKVYRRGGHPKMLEVPSPFGHELAGTIVSPGEAEGRARCPQPDQENLARVNHLINSPQNSGL